MTSSHGPDLLMGSDGLVARSVHPWAQEKLHYIDGYMDIFSNGMKKKWSNLAYIDLFAGPGRSIVEGSSLEIAGSPLLSLNNKYPFTRRYFNDSDTHAVDALRIRVGDRSDDVTVSNLDCNAAARDAVEKVFHSARGRQPLALAVIDPTAFQLTFDALADLTRGRSVDLIVTLMTGYIRRFIEHPSFASTLDDFFGSPEWRNFIDRRAAGAQISFRNLLDFYKSRIGSLGYVHVNDDVSIPNMRGSTIYHLVFASKHELGAEFFQKISRMKFSGQRRMF